MKFLVLLAATVALASGAAFQKKSDVHNVVQFGNMIMCTGNIGPFDAWDYNGYGCYCGLGGKGTPLDATDKCCQVHDACYDTAVSSGTCDSSWDTYSTYYDYENTYVNGQCGVKCKKAADYTWISTDPECREFMCECDRVGAECFANNRDTFSQALVGHDKDSC